jgi:sugar transferase (PEP-CTERM system associated)
MLAELGINALVFGGAFILAAVGQKAMYSEALDTNDIVIAAALAAVTTALTVAFGLYSRSPISLASAISRGTAATCIAAGTFYLILLALTPKSIQLGAIRLAVPYSLLGLILVQALLRVSRSRGVGATRVLVLGSGSAAAGVLMAIAERANPRYRVVGLYESSRTGSETETETETEPALGVVRRFSAGHDLLKVVRELGVQEVIVAVRERRGGAISLRDLLDCRAKGVKVLDEASFYERARGEFPIEALKASWLIYGQGFVQGWVRTASKRVFDLVAATGLMLLSLPVVLITAICISAESSGPVIYRQERVGLGGRRFLCLKFRSMRSDAERDGVAQWASAGDARITRVGRVIRMLRIDELPQLWNVLKGEMSLVGPRPERPAFVEQLTKQMPFYELRHSVKPGLTGWAQVRYSYASSIEESRRKLQFDLYYVKNHSLLMDLLILLETVRVVLFREGAK